MRVLEATETTGSTYSPQGGLYAVSVRSKAADVEVEFEVESGAWSSGGTFDANGIGTLDVPQGWPVRFKTGTAGAIVDMAFLR